jgi:hypothetical protein
MSIYFATIEPFPTWRTAYLSQVLALTHAERSPLDLALAYQRSLINNARLLAYPWCPVIVAVALALTTANGCTGRRRCRTAAALFAGASLMVVAEGIRREWYDSLFLNGLQTFSVYWAVLLTILLSASIIMWRDHRQRSPKLPSIKHGFTASISVLAWLIMLPAAAAVGTINDLSINVLIDLAPWFASYLLLVGWHRWAGRTVAVMRVALLIFVIAYSAEQILWTTLERPYLLTGPLRTQSVSLVVPGTDEPVLVSEDVYSQITEITALLESAGYSTGDAILALYDMPGIAYLMGGISPGQPWYFGAPDAQHRNCEALGWYRGRLQDAYLVVNAPIHPRMADCLAARGIRVPQDFTFLGEVSNAYALNNLGWRSNQRTIKVYAPKPRAR